MATIEPPSDNTAFGLPHDDLVELLATGDMEIEGRMPYSSNATLLVVMSRGDRSHRAIYKPQPRRAPAVGLP